MAPAASAGSKCWAARLCEEWCHPDLTPSLQGLQRLWRLSGLVSTTMLRRLSGDKAACAARRAIPPPLPRKKQCASPGCQLNCAVVSGGRNTKTYCEQMSQFAGGPLYRGSVRNPLCWSLAVDSSSLRKHLHCDNYLL